MSMGSEVDFLHFDMFSTDGGVPVSNPVTMTASPSWDSISMACSATLRSWMM